MNIFYLYIPIWFYSNIAAPITINAIPNFTFQSGSIQILFNLSFSHFFSFFTFQSGSIQMICPKLSCIDLSHFTFQSGSIQILKVLGLLPFFLVALHSNLVLFKYLPIALAIHYLHLYIPIWFYSNGSHFRKIKEGFTLYIPIWFYSNLVDLFIP